MTEQLGQVDILLAAPPLTWGDTCRSDMKPPLNLLYLASWLNQHDCRAKILDVNLSSLTLSEVAQAIVAMKPRFLGVPFYQATRLTGLELFHEVRKLDPGICTIAGGPLATTLPQSLVSNAEVDICVIGEGERTLEEVIKAAHKAGFHNTRKGDDLRCIPGLMFMRCGELVSTAPRAVIENLDDLPFLDFDLIDIHRYFDYYKTIDMSAWLFLTTSRGCQARCTFCATPVLWPDGLRRQSVPRLLAEMSWQRQRYPQAQFAFMDDSFFSDKAWLHEFFAGMKTLTAKYCCIGRADHLRPEEVRLLAETGCIYVAMGIETGNQQRQKSLRKHLDLDKVKTTVQLLKAWNVFSKGFFMIGFPDERPEEIAETINFAIELKRLGLGECSFFPVSIYPGTELAATCTHARFSSTIYDGTMPAHLTQAQSAPDIAEQKLRRYANIPDEDVNAYYSAGRLIDIVKLAYQRFETATFITSSDLPTPDR